MTSLACALCLLVVPMPMPRMSVHRWVAAFAGQVLTMGGAMMLTTASSLSVTGSPLKPVPLPVTTSVWMVPAAPVTLAVNWHW